MRLNKEQKILVDQLEKDYEKKQSAIVGWYTGSGKTTVVNELLKVLFEKHPRMKVGFSAHFFTSLRDQVVEVLGKSHNVSSDPEDKADITIFNPQSIYKKTHIKFDLLVIDEAHEGLSQDAIMLRSIASRAKCVIYLTATAWELISLVPDAKVYLRGLIQGLKEDGRVGEYKSQLHNFDAKIFAEDLDENSEPSAAYLKKNKQLIVDFQKNKLKHMIKEKLIGDKAIVIVPPGPFMDEAVRYLPNSLGLDQYSDEEAVLNKFKNDAMTKFLVVIRKCGVGFDMPTLTDVIDLTMTRNLKQIVQRIGRVVRPHPYGVEKRYHYVYDNRMSRKGAEWYLMASLDLANCEYDGWKNIKLKKMKAPIGEDCGSYYSYSLSALIKSSELETHMELSLQDYKTKSTFDDYVATARLYERDCDWRETKNKEHLNIRRRMKKAGKYKEVTDLVYFNEEALSKRAAKYKSGKQFEKGDYEGFANSKKLGFLPKFYPDNYNKKAYTRMTRDELIHEVAKYSKNSKMPGGLRDVIKDKLSLIEATKSRITDSDIVKSLENRKETKVVKGGKMYKLAIERGLKVSLIKARSNLNTVLEEVKKAKKKSDLNTYAFEQIKRYNQPCRVRELSESSKTKLKLLNKLYAKLV